MRENSRGRLALKDGFEFWAECRIGRPVACGGPRGAGPPAFCLAPLLFCISGLSSTLGPPWIRRAPAAKLSRYGAENRVWAECRIGRPVACGGPGDRAPLRFAWLPAFLYQRAFRPRLAPPPHGSGGPLLQNCHATGLRIGFIRT